jgi:hypothetical protein
MGTLLATCAYSMTLNEWTPVLHSWINHQDTAHHRLHFAHIFESVIKHAGSRFNRKMLLCVGLILSQMSEFQYHFGLGYGFLCGSTRRARRRIC